MNRIHLDLAWLEFSGAGNTQAIIGLRCKLAAFESRRWEWSDLEGRVPASVIAKDIGANEGSRITNLFKGKASLPDAQLERFAACTAVSYAWIISGMPETNGPAWLVPYLDQVKAVQARQMYESHRILVEKRRSMLPTSHNQTIREEMEDELKDLVEHMKTEVPEDVSRYLNKKSIEADNLVLIPVTLSAADWLEIRGFLDTRFPDDLKELKGISEDTRRLAKRPRELAEKITQAMRVFRRRLSLEVRGRSRRR